MLQPDPADDCLSQAELRKKYASVLQPGRATSYAIDCALSELAILSEDGLVGRSIAHVMFDRRMTSKTLVLTFTDGKYVAIEPMSEYDNDLELCFDRLKSDQLADDFKRDDVIASGLMSEDDFAAIAREKQEAADKTAKARVAEEKALYERLKAKYG